MRKIILLLCFAKFCHTATAQNYFNAIDERSSMTWPMQVIQTLDKGYLFAYGYDSASQTPAGLKISKTDSSGHIEWSRRISGRHVTIALPYQGSDSSYYVGCDSVGNPAKTIIHHLSANGTYIGTWNYETSNFGGVKINTFTETASGNFLIHTSTPASTFNNIFLTDHAGNILQDTLETQNNQQYIKSFKDPSGDVYLFGHKGHSKIMVCKINSSGIPIWEKSISDSLGNSLDYVDVDYSNGVFYLCGKQSFDAYFIKLDTAINVMSASRSDIYCYPKYVKHTFDGGFITCYADQQANATKIMKLSSSGIQQWTRKINYGFVMYFIFSTASSQNYDFAGINGDSIYFGRVNENSISCNVDTSNSISVFPTTVTVNNEFVNINTASSIQFNPHNTAPVSTFPLTESVYCQSTIGVNEIEASSFTISPNPVIEYLTVELPDHIKTMVEINVTDINSRLIYSNKTFPNNNQISIDLRDVPDGIYFVTLNCDGKKTTKKFIRISY